MTNDDITHEWGDLIKDVRRGKPMDERAELIERLRGCRKKVFTGMTGGQGLNEELITDKAADRIEADGKRIAELSVVPSEEVDRIVNILREDYDGTDQQEAADLLQRLDRTLSAYRKNYAAQQTEYERSQSQLDIVTRQRDEAMSLASVFTNLGGRDADFIHMRLKAIRAMEEST